MPERAPRDAPTGAESKIETSCSEEGIHVDGTFYEGQNDMLTSSDLYRAFDLTNTRDCCAICASVLHDGVQTRQGFYLTGTRSVMTGVADMVPAHQVAPKNAQTLARGPECTCKGRKAHTKRCAAHVACACKTRTSRYGKKYVSHKKACANSLKWVTLPGYWDVCVHSQCASDAGFVVPANVKVTRGSRAQGHFGGAVDLTPAQRAEADRQSAARAIADAAAQAAWEAKATAARAAQAAAQAVADRNATIARMAAEDPSVARFMRLDLDDAPSAPVADDPDAFDASVERFRRLDLD